MLLSGITMGIILLSLSTDMIAIVSGINGNSEVKKERKKEKVFLCIGLRCQLIPVNIFIIYIYISYGTRDYEENRSYCTKENKSFT